MRCICSHTTALWYWYLAGPAGFSRARPFAGSLLGNATHSPGPSPVPDLAAVGVVPCPPAMMPSAHLDGQVDLLISRRDSWRAPDGVRLHRWNGSFPAGSLYTIDDDVLVCSPELALLQTARMLSDVQVIRLAMTLCARYYIDQETNRVREREPLTSIGRIQMLLSQAFRRCGVRRCGRLLPFAAEPAASPAEIETYLLTSLPPVMGGYGLDGAELNGKIDLTDVDDCLLDRDDRQFARVDLYWRNERVGIEYQSKEHDEQLPKDRRRINMLTSLGESIFQVDTEQRSDVTMFHTTMAQVAHRMRRTLPDPTEEWMSRRSALRRELLGANRMKL